MNKACITVVFVLACSALWGNPDLVASCNQLIGEGKTAECLSLLDSALQTAAAVRLKPDFANAYYGLGLLYASLPGWPLSFGNKDYAVSLLRKAVDRLRAAN